MAIQQTSVDFFAIAETPAHNRDESMIYLDRINLAYRSCLSNIKNNTQRFANFHHRLIS
jgi:hypothetical protein